LRQSDSSDESALRLASDRSAAQATGASNAPAAASSAASPAGGDVDQAALLVAQSSEAGQGASAASSPAEPQQADAQQTDAAQAQPPQTQTIDVTASLVPGVITGASDEAEIPTVPVAAPPSPRTEEQAQLAMIDPDKARRLPQANKESAEMVVLKPGRPDGETKSEREMTATITPKDAIAPPPETPAAGGASRILANQTAKRALRDSSAKPAERGRGLPERRVVKKRFWLINDVWTDKDYKADKELPEVTIVRNSNVYKELLSKQVGLRPYLTSFSENERAVIVYKGTVYKLVPPGAND
jgi:hypothetical protein